MADRTVQLTDREKYMIAAHMLQNITPKDHEEGIKFYDVFKEADLAYSKKLLTNKQLAASTAVDDIDDTVEREVKLSNASINYLIEVTNKPMTGIQTLTLVPLGVRIRAVQLEQYAK